MAFFKFRLPSKAAGDSAGGFGNAPTESVEVMRRRARHRLIGASVLVALGVVGFPLVFDTQPRPVSTDIAVDIPDRATAKPLVAPAPAHDASAAMTGALDPHEEIVASSKVPQADASDPVKPASVEAAKPAPAKDSKEAAQRFVVQVGAFSDDSKVREVRAKLEKAGLKSYTHAAEAKDGKRTRVRVGPFSSRDEADKVANKIKQLQLQPQVLSL